MDTSYFDCANLMHKIHNSAEIYHYQKINAVKLNLEI